DVDAVVERLCEIAPARPQAVAAPPAGVVLVERRQQRLDALLEECCRLQGSESDGNVPNAPQCVDPPVEDTAGGLRRRLFEHWARLRIDDELLGPGEQRAQRLQGCIR